MVVAPDFVGVGVNVNEVLSRNGSVGTGYSPARRPRTWRRNGACQACNTVIGRPSLSDGRMKKGEAGEGSPGSW